MASRVIGNSFPLHLPSSLTGPLSLRRMSMVSAHIRTAHCSRRRSPKCKSGTCTLSCLQFCVPTRAAKRSHMMHVAGQLWSALGRALSSRGGGAAGLRSLTLALRAVNRIAYRQSTQMLLRHTLERSASRHRSKTCPLSCGCIVRQRSTSLRNPPTCATQVWVGQTQSLSNY